MSFSCCGFDRLTCLQFHDLLLPVLVRCDGSLPLASLSVTGLERLVSSCVREGFSQFAPALMAAASQVHAS